MATDLPPFTLLPADEPPITPDARVAAAVAGAVALPSSFTPVADPPAVPLGRSWQFDWDTGQFLHAGGSPADTTGVGALEQWCMMAITSARYAHPVFSDEFGMEEPDSVIGEFAVGEALADWQRHFIEALLVHDRITSIENFDLDWDPTTGILSIVRFDVVTDEGQTLTISDVTVQAGGGLQ